MKILEQAVAVAKTITKNKGSLQDTHCVIEGGMLKATDGQLSVAHPCAMEISFVPSVVSIEDLAKAISDDVTVSFVIEDKKSLSATFGDKRIRIGGADRSLIHAGTYDDMTHEATDDLRRALDVAEKILDPKSQDPQTLYAYSENGVLSASDGAVGMQCYHKSDFGDTVAFSLGMIKAIKKVKSAICGVGYTKISTTVHFENGAYVRGMIKKVSKPDLSHAFSDYPKKERFFDAKSFLSESANISKFSPLKFVEIANDEIRAFKDPHQSCSAFFDANGSHTPSEARAYDLNMISKLKSVKSVAFGESTDRLYCTDNESMRIVTNPVAIKQALLYVEPRS